MKLIALLFILLLGISLGGLLVISSIEDVHVWDTEDPAKKNNERKGE